eukprot:COSAG01_NODE_3190_length_6440_cov_60.127425_4_plen_128_part_00
MLFNARRLIGERFVRCRLISSSPPNRRPPPHLERQRWLALLNHDQRWRACVPIRRPAASVRGRRRECELISQVAVGTVRDDVGDEGSSCPVVCARTPCAVIVRRREDIEDRAAAHGAELVQIALPSA